MLSRLAGSVFRVGAAVERADVIARLLDVYLTRSDPATGAGEPAIARELRVVAGAAIRPATVLDRSTTLEALALDRHEPASIANAVAVARDDARRARDVVSTELWDCLNVTRSRMPRKIASGREHEFLGWVRERSALAIGVVEGDASRDEVWEFFTLGRSLARCAATARLLASDLLEPTSATSWGTALRACGAGEAFHRGSHPGAPATEAAAFLLLDERSPRSVLFLTQRAEECLADVASRVVTEELADLRDARRALQQIPPAEAVDAARTAGARLAAVAERVAAALEDRVFAVAEPAR
ncbi:alpha-E domain-containing protein [Curtobacterium sp. VKM Ac-1395]|uniref:alpha-E domain-containing protein n=1 Tax=Curtobacterium sp. VKM Ac-1395 TaxID=2783815 RepID=UPI00188C855E|nr:alpha-E domain-containing protein [Curtobacterium sp. VKM Ac-1395]MBF4589381.1 alpha-E domain-containing protein [Curtobacterium sp. VKM Ac-1395]